MKKIFAIIVVALFGFTFGCGGAAPAVETPEAPEAPEVEAPEAEAPDMPEAPAEDEAMDEGGEEEAAE